MQHIRVYPKTERNSISYIADRFSRKACRLISYQGVDTMTQAVLNTQLYQKMFAEQEQFKAELMQLHRGRFSSRHMNMSAGRIFCYRWNTMTCPPGKQKPF